MYNKAEFELWKIKKNIKRNLEGILEGGGLAGFQIVKKMGWWLDYVSIK